MLQITVKIKKEIKFEQNDRLQLIVPDNYEITSGSAASEGNLAAEE